MKILNTITSLLLALCLFGCATGGTQNEGLTDAKVKKIAAVVELASYNGVYLFLKDNPEKKDIFVSVVNSLDILLADEITLDKFLLIVKNLPIKELQSDEGKMIVTSSIILFGVFQDDLIKLDQLEQVQKLKPVILALKHGIEQGLM